MKSAVWSRSGKGKRAFVLQEPFRVENPLVPGGVLTIPAGQDSDLASVPRIFWRVFPPHGPYMDSAFFHDFLCEKKLMDSREVHKAFSMDMKNRGVPARYRIPVSMAVRFFGPRFKKACK